MSSETDWDVQTLQDLTTIENVIADEEISPQQTEVSENPADEMCRDIDAAPLINVPLISLDDESLSIETGDVLVSKPSPELAELSPNRSLHSPKISSLHQKKEALKGFVLSKLTKKSTSVSEPHNYSSDLERRTLFSGIKEKFSKKFDDRESYLNPKLDIYDEQDIANKLNELGHKKECELKLIAANNQIDLVDVAEECFEKGISGDKSENENFTTLPLSSSNQSISHFSDKSLKSTTPKFSINKSISVSFSELQEADDLADRSTLKFKRNVPKSLPEASSSYDQNPRSAHQKSNSHKYKKEKIVSNIPPKETEVKKTICLYNKFKISLVFIVFMAIAVYWLHQYNYFFTAGLLCGLTACVSLFILTKEFYQKDEYPSSGPYYQTLPDIPVLPIPERAVHEGWMNQLFGDYDSNLFKISNTVSVHVSIRGNFLHLSYPKKEIPKQAKWNEELPNVTFILENKYCLSNATVTLSPDNVPIKKRLWSRKYPLCISLANKPGLTRSPSVDNCTILTSNETSPLITKEYSAHSLPASLSATPTRASHNANVFYFFARTHREKEMWFWNFVSATKDHSCEIAKEILEEAKLPPKNENPLGEKSEKVPNQKPTLNFAHYMCFLLKELPDQSDKPADAKESLQWLNVVLGRLCYDFLTQDKWLKVVERRIQRKLKSIKMPPYMQKLIVTDTYLGTSLPQIRRTSQPFVDDNGLWLDLDIEYSGGFQCTLETKIKFQLDKNKKHKHDYVETKEEKKEEKKESKKEDKKDDNSSQQSDTSTDMYEEYADSSSDDDLPLDIDDAKARILEPQYSKSTRLFLAVEKWVVSSSLAESKLVKKCVGHLTQTPIVLTVEIKVLCGTLALNIAPLPTNRIWYGFRKKPQFSFTVCPKVGERRMDYTPILRFIEKKLESEFQNTFVLPNMDDIKIPVMHLPIAEIYEKSSKSSMKTI